jgi:recombination protein RecT
MDTKAPSAQDAQTSLQKSIKTQVDTTNLSGFLRSDSVVKRLQELVGENKDSWISSILTVGTSSKQLRECEPKTIVGAAIQSIVLKLPIDKNLGFAYIVPYGKVAQFQLGYKGFIQLAMRSGQYKTINVTAIREGQLKEHNLLTGEITFDNESKTSETVIGYAAYFRLINGFEKTLYMTKVEVEKHASRYSKMFNHAESLWKKDFEKMALKTVLKLLLSKYGILSIDMQMALKSDQAVINDIDSDEMSYIDNVEFEEVE